MKIGSARGAVTAGGKQQGLSLWFGRHPLKRMMLAGVIGCFYLTFTGNTRITQQQQQQQQQSHLTTKTKSLESFLINVGSKNAISKKLRDTSGERERRISTTEVKTSDHEDETKKLSSTSISTMVDTTSTTSSAPPVDDTNQEVVVVFPGYPLTRQAMIETGAKMGRSVVSKWVSAHKQKNPNAWCHPRPTNVQTSFMVPHTNTTRRGLFFVKTPKTASQSINRILRRVALRVGKRQLLAASNKQQSCFSRGHHLQGYTASKWYGQRSPRQSILLTSIRDPAPRALSRIYWTMSTRYQQQHQGENQGRGGNQFNLVDFIQKALKTWTDVESGCISQGKGGFQLSYTSLQSIADHSFWNKKQPTQVQNPIQIHSLVQQIMADYDFILLQERLEESLVAMQLLLGIETTDILSMPLHVGGSYLYDRHSGCLELFSPPKLSFLTGRGNQQAQDVVSSGLNDKSTTTTTTTNSNKNDDDDSAQVIPFLEGYLQSPTWYAQNYGDYVLLGAAQAALDKTIQELGIDKFNVALEQFRTMQKRVLDVCSKKVVFPCSLNGTIQRDDYQLGNPKASGDRYPQKDIEACIDEVILQEQQQAKRDNNDDRIILKNTIIINNNKIITPTQKER